MPATGHVSSHGAAGERIHEAQAGPVTARFRDRRDKVRCLRRAALSSMLASRSTTEKWHVRPPVAWVAGLVGTGAKARLYAVGGALSIRSEGSCLGQFSLLLVEPVGVSHGSPCHVARSGGDQAPDRPQPDRSAYRVGSAFGIGCRFKCRVATPVSIQLVSCRRSG